MSSSLLNLNWIRSYRDTAYTSFHGVKDEYLGTGLLYYSLAYSTKAEVCVCLGSGGGLVPLLMRQAQKDAGIQKGTTYLVDGVLPEMGWGSPQDPGGWETGVLDNAPLFQEVEVIRKTTTDAASTSFARNAISIDYLHVDADHSREGCLDDLINYIPLLSKTSVVTLHDTRYSSIQDAITTFRQQQPDFEIVDFPELAQGVAIARKKLPHDISSKIPEARTAPEVDIFEAERMKAESLLENSFNHTEGKSSPLDE